jgi:hypothetical protein
MKTKLSDSEQVNEHIQKLEPAIAETIEYIRKLVLNTDPEIAERIKWNNPSFYFNGEMAPFDPKEYKRELIVMNLHKGKIMLVLPSGAKLSHESGILEGDYKDGRRLITFADLEDVKSKENSLQTLIKEWISLVER